MNIKDYKVKKEELKVVNGKVLIESEELANMIENEMINFDDEEESGLNICGGGCINPALEC